MPDVPLVELFKAITRAMVAELVERLQAAGYADITVAHHPVFYHLDPGGTRLTDLAVRAGMTHQSMGELVGSLVGIGYLERKPDPEDGRARLVHLTRRGRNAKNRARTEAAAIEADWFARFRAAGLDADLHRILTTALLADSAA